MVKPAAAVDHVVLLQHPDRRADDRRVGEAEDRPAVRRGVRLEQRLGDRFAATNGNNAMPLAENHAVTPAVLPVASVAEPCSRNSEKGNAATPVSRTVNVTGIPCQIYRETDFYRDSLPKSKGIFCLYQRCFL